jgi:excisionase family DNA binding protein
VRRVFVCAGNSFSTNPEIVKQDEVAVCLRGNTARGLSPDAFVRVSVLTQERHQHTMKNTDILMTVAEAGGALKISRSTVEKLIREGKLVAVHFGRAVRITRESAVALVESMAVAA